MLINGIDWREARLLFEAEADSGSDSPDESEDQEQDEQEQDENFDAAKALETIRKLRAFEREAKKLKKENDSLKAQEASKQEAELTAVERAEKKAADALAEKEALAQRYRETTIKGEIRIQALASNFVDPDDAILYLRDDKSIDVEDDGTVVGVKEALIALAKAKPHLVKPSKQTAPDINSTRGTNTVPPTKITPVINVRKSF